MSLSRFQFQSDEHDKDHGDDEISAANEVDGNDHVAKETTAANQEVQHLNARIMKNIHAILDA